VTEHFEFSLHRLSLDFETQTCSSSAFDVKIVGTLKGGAPDTRSLGMATDPTLFVKSLLVDATAVNKEANFVVLGDQNSLGKELGAASVDP